jgi:hypothetical protein
MVPKMNPCFAPFFIVTFFGGAVLGAWLSKLPARRLLAGERVLDRTEFHITYPHLRWVLWVDLGANSLGAIAGFFIVAHTQSMEVICLFGGLVIVLWAELPYALLATTVGVWLNRITNRVSGPVAIIITGSTRAAGLVGIALTAGVTAAVIGVRHLFG